jgi:hypothetical protein
VTRRTRVPPSTDCKSAAPWPASTTLLLPTGGAACHGYEGEVWSLSGRERSSASPLLAALGPPRLDLHIQQGGLRERQWWRRRAGEERMTGMRRASG